ncbi:peptidoglycan/LPS O-acetylase OafA/YrhL [Oceanisphaera litoralis]|uniref:acyltransferase family protein n=1 Tax=Oceanisphaera litoralis TaxID=225144 RepID=UPI00308400A0|nr:peptidoglycan/LPS O-acetylase OafA/YrhL [Oceanisphaera litoralis]
MAFTTYRPDIDGLRAIAVLTVMIFHFNSQWLPGGFIGVDIFFVISGYIITRILYVDVKKDNFSFSLFYAKRIKRILPLFYLVSVTTLVVSWFLLTPDDLVRLADSLRYASVFIANTYFEKNVGYFAPAADTMPLLHMWSLSVEEQFYFVWPLLLFLSIRYMSSGHRKLFFILSLLVLIGISEYAARGGEASAYYLIHNRGSELLAGALLSMFVHDKREALFAREATLAIAGLVGALVLLSLFVFFDEGTVFPGFNALLVSVATAMVILNGELRKGVLYRFLSSRGLALIGRLSFSLYLWHWPVLVLYRYYFNGIDAVGYVACALLTFLLAFLSWRYFEKPLRYLNIRKKWVFIGYFILPVILLVMIAKDIKRHHGYENRMPERARHLYEISISSYDDIVKEFLADSRYLPFKLVPIGDDSLVPEAPKALLWGDSHAGHFRSFVEELGLKNGFYSLYGGAGGCPPFIGVDLIKHGRPEAECTDTNNKLFEVIKQSESSVIFLAGRWAMYTETTRSEGEKGSRVFLGDSSDYSESLENSRRAFRVGMETTIQQLIANNKRPVLFEQAPSYPFLPSNCLIKKATYPWMKDENCDIDMASVTKRQAYANAVIEMLEEKYPELMVIRINDQICENGWCKSELQGVPLYRDDDHINDRGSRLLFDLYLQSDKYQHLREIVQP